MLSTIFFIAMFLIVAAFSLDLFPNFDEKKHECTADTIQASVQQDGSLHVVDARSYHFTGTYSLTAAVLDPPSGGSAVVNGVSVTDASGATTALTEVPFQASWRTSGGPPSGNYAVDTQKNTIYAFSTTTNADKTFTFDYSYTNAITQYSDVDVLYWQFIGKKWDVDTNKITATLTLPVPQGETVKGAQNVYAFGHGDLGGDVAFNENGTIAFTVPKVKSGDFAEMRVAFPTSWTPNISSDKISSGEGLPTIMQEEESWQKEANAKRLQSALMLIIPICISVGLIIWALIMFLKYGKEHKPQFTGEYWRDVPEKGMHPTVAARIWRWNKEDANDITATLMHLSNLGIVSIESEEYTRDRKLLPDKLETTYRLKLHKKRLSNAEAELSKIDAGAVKFIFGKVGYNEESITLNQIEQYADTHAESFVNGVNNWQATIGREVNDRQFFEAKGDHLKGVLRGVALAVAAIGFIISFYTANFAIILGLLPGVIGLFIFSHFMTRRSVDAVEIQARCEGLKRWLEDFTALDEAIPTDARVWGEFLVYAYIFGITEKVVENLNRTIPDIWNDGYFTYSMLWYYSPYRAYGGAASSGDFFGRAFENTFDSARNAVQAASSAGGGGGGFSFGGGGGFSGGGGGGFGGGGGGFSR